jgi:hypothetical protein
VSDAKHAALRRKSNAGWLGIRIMCPSGATCLPADCCFSELALLKYNSACWSRTKRNSSSAELYFNSASSLKQQSAGRHVAPLGHIILSQSQPALLFLLNAACLAASSLAKGYDSGPPSLHPWYLRGATSINHQVALRANFKMYSRSAKGEEKGDPNRNPWDTNSYWNGIEWLNWLKCW